MEIEFWDFCPAQLCRVSDAWRAKTRHGGSLLVGRRKERRRNDGCNQVKCLSIEFGNVASH